MTSERYSLFPHDKQPCISGTAIEKTAQLVKFLVWLFVDKTAVFPKRAILVFISIPYGDYIIIYSLEKCENRHYESRPVISLL
ncbi:hypothetical protein CEXT_583631 [Caerostris extrusa]|uniref:Uncharacterized protein n=1 Tax=Caerostris extrusa TaxID=172846 RepID=A0AAV4XS93_CAEEX|nr:hypothetical protein CEXT_583631 [Caerostris extrusa]